jgi:hypothetical protein
MQAECIERCGGRVWSRAGYADRAEGEQVVVGRAEQGWICRQGMKESTLWWEERSRAGYADRV